ncbi:hypothetical protein OIU79_027726 [Salix purpurea]|uniref:Uncharacterized protein n=1 Tax=Salix purpurea TaxID=77065 RepID=A0A9Q0VVJ9_SALPP|nr:hypothetical protein OIU79_027726 [Salix purpurea]
MGIVIERVRFSEGISGKYRKVMEIVYDSVMAMEITMDLVKLLVGILEANKMVTGIILELGMGIVIEPVRFSEGISGKYRKVMEIVYDSVMAMEIAMDLVTLLVGILEAYKMVTGII